MSPTTPPDLRAGTKQALVLSAIEQALERLRRGDLVAFPTETVWGVAADAAQPGAVQRLFLWKGRDPHQPVSVLVPDVAALTRLDVQLGPAARRLAEAFWPGPLTLVLPCGADFAAGVRGADFSGVRGADGLVGFRCSPHPVARALVAAAAQAGLGPLTATSLNHAGEPAAANRVDAEAICAAPDAPALLAVPGPDAGGGHPSTVVALDGDLPRILREGAIARASLLDALQELRCA